MSKNANTKIKLLMTEREKNILGTLELESVQSSTEISPKNFNSLSSIIAKKLLTVTEMLSITIKIVDVLNILWNKKIIFNNLNPENILINSDFSEVKLLGMQKSSTYSKDSNNQLKIFEISDNFNFISPEQTGRMNRTIDFRSDIYSLGACMYFALTGKNLFFEKDTNRIIHAHLTKIPNVLLKKENNLDVVSELVILKMLKKNAEERYQSALGIKIDLQFLLDNSEHENLIEKFVLGTGDNLDTFVITEKIFGRENEIEKLMLSYQKVVYGRSRIVLVGGNSGVGKTALVNEVRKPIMEHNGYFLSGKYDQLNKKNPFSSFIQALNKGIDEMISNEHSLAWKKDLEIRLGDHLEILSRYLPKLATYLGNERNNSTNKNKIENVNLLNTIFTIVIESLKDNEMPLVLFLDDLQWADSATFSLIKHLSTDKNIKNLLIICGYRDNEVGLTHPFQLCINEITEIGGEVEKLIIGNLTKEDSIKIVATSLNRPERTVVSLAEALHKKTQGNAFFLKELFKSFYDKKLIVFNEQEKKWAYLENEILKTEVSENLLVLLIQKFNNLDKDILLTLQSASVIGAEFDLTTLSLFSSTSATVVFDNLLKCLELDYIVPLDSNYRYIGNLQNVYLNSFFKFSHDKIQQAAFESIEPLVRQNYHARIFRILYDDYNNVDSTIDVFNLAFHLENARSNTTVSDFEKAKIYKVAGFKAFNSSAYSVALTYFEYAYKLMAEDKWETQYTDALEISSYMANCYYLCAKAEEAEYIFKLILENAKSIEDQAQVYELQMNFFTNQGRADEAIAIAAKALALYGITFPLKSTLLKALPLLIRVKLKFALRSNENILNTKELTDPHALAALKILSNVSPSCFIQSPESMLINCLNSLLLTLKYGNTGVSSYAISLMGFVEAVALSNYKRAHDLMILATNLNLKLGAKDYESKVIFAWNNFVQFYHSPIKESLPWLRKGHESGILCGDFNFANYSLYSILCREIYLGENLSKTYFKACEYSSFSTKIGDKYIIPMMQVMRVYLSRLSGEVNPLYAEKDYDFDYQKFESNLPDNDVQNKSWVNIFEIMYCYNTKRIERAIECILKCDSFIEDGTQKQIVLFDYYFYSTLTLCEVSFDGNSKITKGMAQSLVNKYVKRLKKLSKVMPENFRSRYHLMKAKSLEMFSQESKEIISFEYNRAINFARIDGFKNVEAIGLESYSKYCGILGLQYFESENLKNAIESYFDLGDHRKSNSLITQSSKSLMDNLNQSFDIDKLIEITNMISSERNTESLIKNIIDAAILYTNANGGTIVDINRFSKVDFPRSLIEYTFNSVEEVILDDANSSPFKNDQYILSKKIKSVLAIPLKINDTVRYVLYLESNELYGVFTSEKVVFINYIASQIALSLENAVIFDQLEKKVEIRTEQLSNALNSKEGLVRILCHDLNNLLQIIVGAVYAHSKIPDTNIVKQNQYWDKVKSAAELQKDLIEHVRQLEAINSGKIKLEISVKQLYPIFEKSLMIFQSKIEEKSLIISFNQSDFENVYIYCEEISLLNNILNNVISNAIKFSNNGDAIDFNIIRSTDNIVLTIKDHGIGMPKIIQDNLFLKDRPTSRPGTNGEKGTGFGMPLMKTYIELMYGEVSVESIEYDEDLDNRDKSGTTFKLFFKKAENNTH